MVKEKAIKVKEVNSSKLNKLNDFSSNLCCKNLNEKKKKRKEPYHLLNMQDERSLPHKVPEKEEEEAREEIEEK